VRMDPQNRTRDSSSCFSGDLFDNPGGARTSTDLPTTCVGGRQVAKKKAAKKKVAKKVAKKAAKKAPKKKAKK
jgi:hypothetical protein